MKLLIILLLFFSINLICNAQIQEKKEQIPVAKKEINGQLSKQEIEKLKPEEIEKLKIANSSPAVFYIINDKAVSREEYMLYLSEQEKKKEKNPNQQ